MTHTHNNSEYHKHLNVSTDGVRGCYLLTWAGSMGAALEENFACAIRNTFNEDVVSICSLSWSAMDVVKYCHTGSSRLAPDLLQPSEM